jgi:hypothetical protein
MREITEYEFDPEIEQFSVYMPSGSTILTAQVKNEKLVIWALATVDTWINPAKRNFIILETGVVSKYIGNLQFIATLQLEIGTDRNRRCGRSIHLFEEK